MSLFSQEPAITEPSNPGPMHSKSIFAALKQRLQVGPLECLANLQIHDFQSYEAIPDDEVLIVQFLWEVEVEALSAVPDLAVRAVGTSHLFVCVSLRGLEE